LVTYHDPYIPGIKTENESYQSVILSEETIKASDCVVITTNHSAFNIDMIKKHSQLIVDLRNAIKDAGENVYKL
jgi:UDP-N-acetyl-D-glucosamine dehydrogenase